MRALIVFLVHLLLVIPVYAEAGHETQANQEDVSEEKDAGEDVFKDTVKPATGGRISDIIQDGGGLREIKPINLEEMGDKFLEFGIASYETLQKASVILLVWGIGISAVILFLGLIIGKKMVLAGIGALVITFLAFLIIQFAPETIHSIINAVTNN